jgi:methylthioribose-1-phosphate isomerase
MRVDKKIPLVYGVPDKGFYKSLKGKEVFVAELRPDIEGIKVVGPALLEAGIQPVIICDNMMAFCLGRGLVSAVHIFYEKKDAETALCRTGSLVAALCAKEHQVPVHLHKGPALKKKASSLLKIDGKTVTSGKIKTYVPLAERVPLAYVTE